MPHLEIELAKIGRSALTLVEEAKRRPGHDQTVDGRVHSVFRRVVNFAGPDGRLFALTAPGVPCAPNSLVAASAPKDERSWSALGLEAGDPLRLTVGVGQALLYRPLIHCLPELAAPFAGRGKKDDALRIAVAAAARSSAASPLATETPFAAAAQPHLRQLTEVVESAAMGAPLDEGRLASAARGLIGLGPGLTPSGDDLLAGFMVAFAVVCAAQGYAELALEQVNPVILRQAVGRTTEVSLESLRCAALGEGNELVDELLAAILAGDTERSAAAAAQLARIGATSGQDQLLGIRLGFRVGLTGARGASPA